MQPSVPVKRGRSYQVRADATHPMRILGRILTSWTLDVLETAHLLAIFWAKLGIHCIKCLNKPWKFLAYLTA